MRQQLRQFLIIISIENWSIPNYQTDNNQSDHQCLQQANTPMRQQKLQLDDIEAEQERLDQQQFANQIQVYDYILQKQKFEIDRDKSKGQAACLTHVLFKAIVILLLYFKPALLNFLQQNLIHQLMFFFSVVDFWFTKNYNGRKLAGLRWSFSQDLLGKQRFKFECRINQQYISRINVRIFWLVQVVYIFFPVIYFYVEGLAYDLDQGKIFQFSLLIFIDIIATINLVFFYKAQSFATRKKLMLRQKLSAVFLTKFGSNSLISYL